MRAHGRIQELRWSHLSGALNGCKRRGQVQGGYPAQGSLQESASTHLSSFLFLIAWSPGPWGSGQCLQRVLFLPLWAPSLGSILIWFR